MMPEAHSAHIEDFEPMPVWQWSKTRNVGVSVAFWPIEWHLGARRWSDQFCWVGTLDLGPFVFEVNVNCGWPKSDNS